MYRVGGRPSNVAGVRSADKLPCSMELHFINVCIELIILLSFTFDEMKLVRAFTQNGMDKYEPEQHGEFSLFGGNISGKFIQLVSSSVGLFTLTAFAACFYSDDNS